MPYVIFKGHVLLPVTKLATFEEREREREGEREREREKFADC